MYILSYHAAFLYSFQKIWNLLLACEVIKDFLPASEPETDFSMEMTMSEHSQDNVTFP